MIDPLGGIFAFLGLLIDDVSKKNQAARKIAQSKPKPSCPEPSYPEPHRDPVSGKVMIENSKLYYEDVRKYGAYKAQQWVNQGKYNLSPEELRKEEERIKEKYKKLFGEGAE